VCLAFFLPSYILTRGIKKKLCIFAGPHFGSIQPHQQYPSPDNNNFSAKPVHYVKQQQRPLPPDTYVPVHRSSGRLSNGFAPHNKMPPGSKV
jgi:hypothetical protein